MDLVFKFKVIGFIVTLVLMGVLMLMLSFMTGGRLGSRLSNLK